ncbi:Protein of unknown function [Pyronema omphalodes CBS 100304]|uniref:Uncharacterized protein n=1 Tax=Pyronema omphalodes (strain CBS 100304) TaxID=1076935 RepID=U4LWB1_PYROM|nr:Protein of unknown function [Pyronema omphalodes CBS 100304]
MSFVGRCRALPDFVKTRLYTGFASDYYPHVKFPRRVWDIIKQSPCAFPSCQSQRKGRNQKELPFHVWAEPPHKQEPATRHILPVHCTTSVRSTQTAQTRRRKRPTTAHYADYA